MGICSSSQAGEQAPVLNTTPAAGGVDTSQIVFDEPLLVRLISAHNMPALDLMSESDVYVDASLVGSGGEVVAAAKWPAPWSTP